MILACRNMKNANEAVRKIKEEKPTAEVNIVYTCISVHCVACSIMLYELFFASYITNSMIFN